MSLTLTRNTLTEFIDVLRSEPCLWLVSSENYSNKNMRNAAYEKLLSKMQKDIKNATIQDVKKKLKNLKKSLNRELDKISKSKESEEVYVPRLWYFNSIRFLKSTDSIHLGDSSFSLYDGDQNNDNEETEIEEDDEISNESVHISDLLSIKTEKWELNTSDQDDEISNEPIHISSHSSMKTERRKVNASKQDGEMSNESIHISGPLSITTEKRKNNLSEQDEISSESVLISGPSSIRTEKRKLNISEQHNEIYNESVHISGPSSITKSRKLIASELAYNPISQDEYESFGQTVSRKLRKLAQNNKMPALKAEHLINQVLYRAESGTLFENTEIMENVTPLSHLQNVSHSNFYQHQNASHSNFNQHQNASHSNFYQHQNASHSNYIPTNPFIGHKNQQM